MAADPATYPTREVVAPVGGPVYVVDQSHPKASDDNPGTPAAPWKTIGKAAATAKAGDTVYVMEGDYREQIKFAHSGKEGQPIVFKGLPRHKAKVGILKDKTCVFDTTGCNYLRLEGFLIVDSDLGVEVASDHVSVVDNRFEGMQSQCIDAPDQKKIDHPAAAYIAFNKMYKVGKGMTTGGNNWLVERNEIQRLYCFDKGDCDYFRPFGDHMTFRQNYGHGSIRKEVKGSHVDAFQVFEVDGYMARDILIEENVMNGYALGLMMECSAKPDFIRNFTFRRNIFLEVGVDGPWVKGALSGACHNMILHGNTILGGGNHLNGVNDRVENNLFYNGFYWFGADSKGCTSQRNLVFYTTERLPVTGMSSAACDYSKNVLNVDPLFVDLAKDNVRLKKGSPAIGAGVGGVTIGALEYPNVYYVDQRHGGASDEGFGYPGAPFKTIAKALSVAEPGETVLVRGGTYRELVTPTRDGVTIKAAKGEKVVISGADEITGWKRSGERGDKWTAPVAARPTMVLKDGKAFAGFSYDNAAKTVIVSGFDPRLCLMETVVRQKAIDLSAAPGTKVEGLETANTLGEAVTGKGK